LESSYAKFNFRICKTYSILLSQNIKRGLKGRLKILMPQNLPGLVTVTGPKPKLEAHICTSNSG